MKLRFLADILTFVIVWNLFYPWIKVPLSMFAFGNFAFMPQFKLVFFSILCLMLFLDFTFFTMKKIVTTIVLFGLATLAFQNWAVAAAIAVVYFILCLVFPNKHH